MISDKTKSLTRKCWIFYAAGFAYILGIKYFYSKAGSNDLQWILAPTAWWAKTLGGISFEYQSQVGYISHSYEFIIAASCSGVQFMMITSATLLYSFVHRMKTMKRGFIWMALSIAGSYLFTVFVNGFRIVLSIYLPLFLKPGIGVAWLTPARLHTIIGTAVYFSSLFAAYVGAGYISLKMAANATEKPDCIRPSYAGEPFPHIIRRLMPPVFWYFLIVLGIPLLNRAFVNNPKGFIEYTVLMSAVCMAVIALYCLGVSIDKYIRR